MEPENLLWKVARQVAEAISEENEDDDYLDDDYDTHCRRESWSERFV